MLANPNVTVLQESVSLFPNPANRLVHIVSTRPILKAAVYDLTGRLVGQEDVANNKFDVSGLSEATYIVKMLTDDKKIVYKYLVRKE